jgi:hypothetical protein
VVLAFIEPGTEPGELGVGAVTSHPTAVMLGPALLFPARNMHEAAMSLLLSELRIIALGRSSSKRFLLYGAQS